MLIQKIYDTLNKNILLNLYVFLILIRKWCGSQSPQVAGFM